MTGGMQPGRSGDGRTMSNGNRSKLTERIGKTASDVRHAAAETAENFKDRAEVMSRRTRKNMRRHPAAWTSAALGAGAVVGWLIGRNGRRHHHAEPDV